MLSRFRKEGWRAEGYAGFEPLLSATTRDIPSLPGVYAVVRAQPGPVSFLATSSGGHFKGKDPTVSTSVLTTNWVHDTDTVYIGKATNLRSRISQYQRFGNGKQAPHWGGRLVWQLGERNTLLICWKAVQEDPRESERQIIAEFLSVLRARPFANLKD